MARNIKQEKDLSSGPSIFISTGTTPSHQEILAALPSKHSTDMLVTRFFNSYDPAVHVLHQATFRKQYDRHWDNPKTTSIVWIGLLFAMMRLSMLSYERDGDAPPEFQGKLTDYAQSYRVLVSHCLVLSDYTKPLNHMIETLILHLHGEFTRNKDSEIGIWVLVGIIVRLAMRMGYHRDPKPFKNISPFHGEMRRRVWTFIRQSDLLFSFQIGLPSMVRTGDCDASLPSNIHDNDLYEDMVELPPPRPDAETTPVSYMICKARFAFIFGKVVEEVNSVQSCPYEKILEMDRELRDAREAIPVQLKVRPLDQSTLDPTTLIMQRFSVSMTPPG